MYIYIPFTKSQHVSLAMPIHFTAKYLIHGNSRWTITRPHDFKKKDSFCSRVDRLLYSANLRRENEGVGWCKLRFLGITSLPLCLEPECPAIVQRPARAYRTFQLFLNLWPGRTQIWSMLQQSHV